MSYIWEMNWELMVSDVVKLPYYLIGVPHTYSYVTRRGGCSGRTVAGTWDEQPRNVSACLRAAVA